MAAGGKYPAKEKVYCSKCIYLWGDIECWAPENVDYSTGDWLNPPEKIPYRSPDKINKKNKCPWFKAKTNISIEEKFL